MGTAQGYAMSPATSPENDFLFGEEKKEKLTVAQYTENENAIVRNLLRDYLEAGRILGIRDELTGQAEKSLKRWQHLLLEVTDRSLNGMKILKKQIHITAIFPSSMSCIREEGLPRKHRSFMRLREPVFYGEGMPEQAGVWHGRF